MRLIKRSGSFELWTEGSSRGLVITAKGESTEPNRVTVELFSSAGVHAADNAKQVFNALTAAMAGVIATL